MSYNYTQYQIARRRSEEQLMMQMQAQAAAEAEAQQIQQVVLLANDITTDQSITSGPSVVAGTTGS